MKTGTIYKISNPDEEVWIIMTRVPPKEFSLSIASITPSIKDSIKEWGIPKHRIKILETGIPLDQLANKRRQWKILEDPKPQSLTTLKNSVKEDPTNKEIYQREMLLPVRTFDILTEKCWKLRDGKWIQVEFGKKFTPKRELHVTGGVHWSSELLDHMEHFDSFSQIIDVDIPIPPEDDEEIFDLYQPIDPLEMAKINGDEDI